MSCDDKHLSAADLSKLEPSLFVCRCFHYWLQDADQVNGRADNRSAFIVEDLPCECFVSARQDYWFCLHLHV